MAGLACSVLFAILFVNVITPRGFLSGTSSYWQTQLEDIAQYYSGYIAYMKAPWSLPVLAIPSLNWPAGTSVTFVDGIPVFSLACKLLSSFVPLPGNPFGWWVLICFALQGAGAWYAISQLEEGSWWALALAVLFCVMMPSLTARMGHLSLQAHFILLFSLGFYIRTQRLEKSMIVAWTVLILLAFYINFYLTAMAIAILVAGQIDLYRKSARIADLALIAVPLVVVAATVPVMLGTAFGKAFPDPGFGYYSLNLLTPIAHGSILKLPFFRYGTNGQYEGYNYLGLGLILLIALAFTPLAAKRAGFRKPGPALVAMLLLCCVYALSNDVYAGPLHLLHWNVPGFLSPLFESFRSSGRFFWVVSYAIVLYTIARFGLLGLWIRITLAIALVAVQMIDIQPTFAAVKQALKREANEPADLTEWKAALHGVTTIHAFPKFKCDGALIRETLPLQMIAARGGFNLTTGFISRYGADCSAIKTEIDESDPATSAYVFTRAQFTDAQIAAYAPAGAECHPLEIWIICRKGAS